MAEIKLPKNILEKYPGKRVAIVDGKVIAVSSNAKDCYDAAKIKYPNREILIYHVPRKEERYHLYALCAFHIRTASRK